MSTPHRTSSSESVDSIRKRVGKACDRCRLKKSKCDGSSPCSRCKTDNAICVFGERKKSHDKVYPKGYVEMLEQQQSQLVTGLQETYRRLLSVQAWPGDRLSDHNGNPLTHDILATLGLLEPKQDGSGEMEIFEEDCLKLQQKLTTSGAPLVARRGSFSSDDDHEQSHRHTRNTSYSSMPASPISTHVQPIFDAKWGGFGASSPLMQTQQNLRQSQSQSPQQRLSQSRPAIRPSPLSSEPIVSHDAFLQPRWQGMSDDAFVQGLMRSDFALETPTAHDNLSTMMDSYSQAMDPSLDHETAASYHNQMFAGQAQFGLFNAGDWMSEPMDVDFSKFVQIST